MRLIYITGYGRSGSTILDITLGQAAGTFGMGELSCMCRHVWPRNEYCACGARVRDCDLWAGIMADWGGDIDAYHALQRRVEGLVARGRLRPREIALFRERTRALYAAVARRTGATTLVDSSKMPGRALALAGDPGLDLRLVHLVRDPASVVRAMARPIPLDLAQGVQKRIDGKPALRTALRWSLYNGAAEILRRRLPPDRSIRLRYEDLVADPATAIARLAGFAEIDLSETIDTIRAGRPIRPGHQMAGSRIRTQEALVLKPQPPVDAPISGAAERAASWLTAPFANRYAYGA